MLTFEKLKHREFDEKDLSKNSYIPNSKFGELGLGLYLHVKENISYYGMWGYDTDEIELILVRPPEWVENQFKEYEYEEISSDWYFWTKKVKSDGE